jgi:predicted phage terminase large subunit-like protein
LIEDAANGPAVSQILRKTVPGIELVTPLGGKVARANASGVYHSSGNVLLPQPEHAPWVRAYIEEHTSFPFGANDDQVDAQSQAINHLSVQFADYAAMVETMKKLGIA